ncbi:MAG: HAD family phosphatase [Bdellovibrionota bacterium]
MSEIDSIVFDVGRVLFDFDHEISFAFLEKHGASFDRESFFRDVFLDQYERGELTTDEFIARLEALFPKPVVREALLEHWQDIFTPIPEMLELLDGLKDQYRVFLLSNTCHLHWSFLDSEYDIESIAHGCLTSFGAGLRKPDPDIFLEAERRFALTPARSVFIDDIEENVRTAAARGWKTVHHVSPSATRDALRKLGVMAKESSPKL